MKIMKEYKALSMTLHYFSKGMKALRIPVREESRRRGYRAQRVNGVDVSGRRESSGGALGDSLEGRKTQRAIVGEDSKGKETPRVLSGEISGGEKAWSVPVGEGFEGMKALRVLVNEASGRRERFEGIYG